MGKKPPKIVKPDFVDGICNSDCVAGMRKLIRPGSVDLAFADPPFNIDFDYDLYNDRRPVDDYLSWCDEWLSAVYRCLQANGTFWLAIGPAMVSELDVRAKALGFKKRSHVIWYQTFGVNSVRKFTPSHTHLLYYTKHHDNFTFNAEQLRVPSARQLVYNDKRANPDGRLPDDTWILRPQELPAGFAAEGDVWHIPRICGTFKQRAETPNQMPEQLLGRVIRACSHPGDLVLDPFVGSGTSLAVAKKLGRRYVGFELSAAYTDKARERLLQAAAGDILDGPLPQGG